MANEERGLIIYQSRDGQEIKLSFDTVRKYLVNGKPELVTEQEIMLYMGMCKARGLNPFKRDCYLVKYTPNDPAATIVSIDYFRSRAKAQPDCAGWNSGIIVLKENNALEYRKGSLFLDGETLIGGWFRAKPKDWGDEYEWTVSLKPYVKKTNTGQVTRFWSEDNQPLMIAKVAESQGLRRLWPDEFQSLFVEDEIIETTGKTEAEPAKELPVIAHKITEAQRKKFVNATAKQGWSNEDVTRVLKLYDYESTHDIMTDKFDEILALVNSPVARAPSDNPQSENNAPEFILTAPEADGGN